MKNIKRFGTAELAWFGREIGYLVKKWLKSIRPTSYKLVHIILRVVQYCKQARRSREVSPMELKVLHHLQSSHTSGTFQITCPLLKKLILSR